jgi:hypothetical protein
LLRLYQMRVRSYTQGLRASPEPLCVREPIHLAGTALAVLLYGERTMLAVLSASYDWRLDLDCLSSPRGVIYVTPITVLLLLVKGYLDGIPSTVRYVAFAAGVIAHWAFRHRSAFPPVPDHRYHIRHGENQDGREAALWAALLRAEPGGVPTADLMTMRGMGHSS